MVNGPLSDKVEVVIDSVRLSLLSPQRVVVLRQTDMQRYLAVWVGPFEAEAISVALQEVELARPLTHDLLKNVIGVFGGKILRIEIISLKDDTFYGNIIAEQGGKVLDIDSRPSDALALAVRAHVPILVSREVMDAAGIIPEHDIQSERYLPEQDNNLQSGGQPAVREQDLEVFEDFLKKLKDEPGEDETPGKTPGKGKKPPK
jgi:uncharacterized protein